MDCIRNSLAKVSICSTSLPQFTQIVSSSVFVKRQVKLDPEIAKQREFRKRRRLEKAIRELKKHSMKPKPVEEMTIDIQSAKNLSERVRPPVEVSEEILDERVVIRKEYSRERNRLMMADDKWIRCSLARQTRALELLKELSPQLYEEAVQPDPEMVNSFKVQGPSFTPPIQGYAVPDGDYIDVTKTWSNVGYEFATRKKKKL